MVLRIQFSIFITILKLTELTVLNKTILIFKYFFAIIFFLIGYKVIFSNKESEKKILPKTMYLGKSFEGISDNHNVNNFIKINSPRLCPTQWTTIVECWSPKFFISCAVVLLKFYYALLVRKLVHIYLE